MKTLNEKYYYGEIKINEDMRFEALQMLRDTQSSLVAISFLPVISIMKEKNPLRKEVLKFQDDLDSLTKDIQEFISKAKNDIDYIPAEDEDGGDAGDASPAKDTDSKPKDDKDTSTKDADDADDVEDSSQPKDK